MLTSYFDTERSRVEESPLKRARAAQSSRPRWGPSWLLETIYASDDTPTKLRKLGVSLAVGPLTWLISAVQRS